MLNSAQQNAIRRIRRQLRGLKPFRMVNDDDSGKTYVADFWRGTGYVIVEFFYGPEDGCSVAISRQFGIQLTAYYTVSFRG